MNSSSSITINDMELNNIPRLSHFVRIAQEMASIRRASGSSDASLFMHSKIGYSQYLGDMSYHEMVASIYFLIIGILDMSEYKLRLSLDMLPKNAYSLYLLSEIFAKNINFKKWASVRIDDITKWAGREDTISIGDSHSHFSFCGISRCKIKWLGPVTMHRIRRSGFQSFGLNSDIIPQNGNVIFSFGQIDASHHIRKQAKLKGISIYQEISSLVSDYICSLLVFCEKRNDINIIVSGIIPPLLSSNHEPGECSYKIVETCLILNSVIERNAMENGLIYLDMYSGFCDENGFLKKECSFGDHHLNSHLYDNVEKRILRSLHQSKKIEADIGNIFSRESCSIPEIARVGLKEHKEPLEITRMKS